MMMWFPFICLGSGYLIGVKNFSGPMLKCVEAIGNIALIALMFSIGINIGTDDVVISSAGMIGLQCGVISICAIFFSVAFVVLLEKTILPLDRFKNMISNQQIDAVTEVKEKHPAKKSSLVWVIPISIMLGTCIGFFFIPQSLLSIVEKGFMISLAVLYISVGIGLSQNKKVFQYVKVLGGKVILLSVAIFIGSITGGVAASLVLGIKPYVAILSASGMSYYSITGAFLTQTYGIQVGAYGFLVNIFREFFTVLMLPILIRISKGAPIAAGAAGNMDTMLVPVSRFVGIELGFVALITGTILTFVVPIVLPVLSQILS